MTAPDGYVDAGKLEIEVVADTKGLARDLRAKVEAAAAGVDAEVGAKVDVAALRAKVEAAAAGTAATVDVDLDATRLRADLKAAIAAAQAGQSAKVPVGGGADVKDTERLADAQTRLIRVLGRARTATNQLHDARQALADAEKRHGKESEQYTRALGRVTQAQMQHNDAITRGNAALLNLRRLATAGGATIPADVELRLNEARAELLAFLRPRELRVDVDVDVDRNGVSRGIMRAAGLVQKSLAAMIVPGFAALITGAAISLTGLVGALAGVVAAAAPAVGTIGLLPAVLGGVGLAIAPVVMGLGGLGDAMSAIASGDAKKLQEAMKKLSPEARKLVLQLALIRPAWAQLRREVQDNFLFDVGAAVRRLSDTYLPVLGRALKDVAASWNLAFRDATAVLVQQENVGLMARGFNDIALAGRNLAVVTGDMTQAFIDLFTTGAPFVERMTLTISQWTVSFAEMLDRTRRSGELAAFFERSVDKATQLGRIIRDLTIGIYQFFRAGSASNDAMLDSLEAILARFREWTASVEGQTKIARFFENVRIIARGVGDAIGWISRKLAELGGLFAQLPPSVKENIGPLLIIGGLVSIIAGKVLALVPLVQLIATGVGAIGAVALIKIVAVVVAVTAAFVALGAAVAYAWNTSEKFRTLVTTGFATVKGVVVDTWRTLRPIFDQWAAVFTEKVRPAIDKAIDVFSERVTPAFREVKRIYQSDVKPALEDLVRKFQEARPQLEILGEKLGWVLVKLAEFGGSAAFGAIVTGFTILAGAIRATVAVVSFLITVFTSVVDVVSAVPGQIQSAWSGLLGFFRGVGAGIEAGWTATLGFFRDLPARVGAALVALATVHAAKLEAMWTAAKERSRTAIYDLVAYVNELPFRMVAALLNGAASIITFFTNLWQSAKTSTVSGGTSIVEWVRGLPDQIYAAVYSLSATMGTWAYNTWLNVRARFYAGVESAVEATRALPGRVYAILYSLAGETAAWASGVWSAIRARFAAGVASTVSVVAGMRASIVGAVQGIAGALRDVGAQIVDGMVDGIRSGLGRVRQAAANLANAIPGPIRSLLGIASPSKVLAQIGQFTAMGLEQGMLGQLGRVRSAAEMLAQSMVISPGLVPITASAGVGGYARGAAAASAPITPPAAVAGADVNVNVYPAAKQSEREIGVVAAREVKWGLTPR